MPITRVPVAHKFGIISQTQRVELEKRIAKKAFLEVRQKLQARQPPEPRPLPFEVTEEFVYKFNDSSPEDKEKQEDTAMKMLIRLKRLAGLRQAGEAHYVDLPRALVDLALLAQCRSPKLEEACLEALIASLDQVLVCEEQILSLFYLAKSGVHWLKKDVGSQSVLRRSEILLLKMTRLVFIRLYCHHLLDQLKEYEDQRKSLGQYLEGFTEKARSFDQFPGAYLSVQLICEAGRAVCSSNVNTRGTQSQNELISATSEKRESMDTMNIKSQSMDKQENRNGQKRGLKDETQEDDGLITDQQRNKTNHDKDGTSDDKEGLFSKDNASHSVQPRWSLFLQCSLNVWHSVNHNPESLNDTLCDLVESAEHLSQEQWLDLVLAFHILAEASCSNVRVLEAFQCFMSLDFSPVFTPVEQVPRLCETCYSSLPTSPEKKACNSTTFRDRLSKSENIPSAERNTAASLVKTLQEFVGLDLTQEPQCTSQNMEQRKSQDSTTYTGQPREPEQEVNIHADSYVVLTRTERSHPGYRWPWELVYTFCECLTNICLYGASADIQKFSLLGMRERTLKRHQNGMSNSGLVQFLRYDDDEDSWKVRYGAVKSLVRICRHYSNDVTKEGVTNTAWSSLVESQSSESEPRVLEATKIAKVEAELEKKLTEDHIPISLWTSRIASALSPTLHYHISAGSDTPTCSTTRAHRSNTEKISRHIPAPCHPERCKKPSLRQEVKLSNSRLKPKASYSTRMNLELRAVIEDQWKKQLIQEMEDEIKTDIEQLDKQREQELEANEYKM